MERVGFGSIKTAAAGGVQQLSQFLQVKISEGLRRHGLGQQLPRRGQKHAGKQGFVFREDTVEHAQEFAFAIADLIREMIAKARDVFQLQEHGRRRLGRFGSTEAQELGNPNGVGPIALDLAHAALAKSMNLQRIEHHDPVLVLGQVASYSALQ